MAGIFDSNADNFDPFADWMLPGIDFANIPMGTEDFLLETAAQRPSAELAQAL